MARQSRTASGGRFLGRIGMKVMWCWRCGMDIPMLEPDEARQVWDQQYRGLATLDRESIRRIYEQYAGDSDGLHQRLEFERESGGMLREYERITGYPETQPTALYHHQTALYGPPCHGCGKPLRTPRAKLCGSCMRPVIIDSRLPQSSG
jgi:hypothetical protein